MSVTSGIYSRNATVPPPASVVVPSHSLRCDVTEISQSTEMDATCLEKQNKELEGTGVYKTLKRQPLNLDA